MSITDEAIRIFTFNDTINTLIFTFCGNNRTFRRRHVTDRQVSRRDGHQRIDAESEHGIDQRRGASSRRQSARLPVHASGHGSPPGTDNPLVQRRGARSLYWKRPMVAALPGGLRPLRQVSLGLKLCAQTLPWQR